MLIDILLTSLVIFALSDLVVFSLQAGHRLDFAMYWIGYRIAKRKGVGFWYKRNLAAIRHQGKQTSIEQMDEVHDYLAMRSKIMGILTCRYCFSVCAAILISLCLYSFVVTLLVLSIVILLNKIF